jgi:hypothetical protein
MQTVITDVETAVAVAADYGDFHKKNGAVAMTVP